MITIEIRLDPDVAQPLVAGRLTADDSSEATAIVREMLEVADERQEPRLFLRVTGEPTAAACRHHPLSPGTIGDPRR